MSVNAGGYGAVRAQSRFRAAVNARLEEISFRAGVTAAMIALLALAAIATAGVFAATLSLGGTAVAAQSAPAAPHAAVVPKTDPTTTASTRPTTSAHPRVTATPHATHPVTAAIVAPQSTAGSRTGTATDGSQPSSRYNGRTGFGGHGSWHGSWPGPGGPGFIGRGGPGSFGQGFGSGPGGFGRP